LRICLPPNGEVRSVPKLFDSCGRMATVFGCAVVAYQPQLLSFALGHFAKIQT
jgi:hypothetical protein